MNSQDDDNNIKCPRCGFEGTRNEFERGIIFNFINEKYIEDMIEILKGLPPRLVALILGHMDNEIAGKFLTELPSKMQKDVIKIIGELVEVELETVQKLDEILKEKLDIKSIKRRDFYGMECAANILHASTEDTQDEVLEQLAEKDLKFSHRIARRLFSKHINRISDKKLIQVLQEVPAKTIAYALKAVNESLKARIHNNLPKRRQEAIIKEIEDMPEKVHIKAVDNAQRSIMEATQEIANE